MRVAVLATVSRAVATLVFPAVTFVLASDSLGQPTALLVAAAIEASNRRAAAPRPAAVY